MQPSTGSVTKLLKLLYPTEQSNCIILTRKKEKSPEVEGGKTVFS